MKYDYVGERERERERQTERETERQRQRQTETETERERQTDRQTDRHKKRWWKEVLWKQAKRKIDWRTLGQAHKQTQDSGQVKKFR